MRIVLSITKQVIHVRSATKRRTVKREREREREREKETKPEEAFSNLKYKENFYENFSDRVRF